MRVLCVCERGNSRSVGLAWLLKDVYGIEAIACGISATSHATMEMLLIWADKVVCMQEHIQKRLKCDYGYLADDAMLCEVGDDSYWRGVDNSLAAQCDRFVQEVLEPGRSQGQSFQGGS